MKEEKIKVLALLPMELPKEIELDNTLDAMQKFVGGLIECITLSDPENCFPDWFYEKQRASVQTLPSG